MSFTGADRPILDDLAWTPQGKALLGTSLLLIAALCSYLGLVWESLPQEVPRHFGIGGAPDAWGDKSLLLVLPCAQGVITLLLVFAAQVPHAANLPVRVTELNARRVYAEARLFALWVCVLTNGLLGSLVIVAVRIAGGHDARGALPAALGVYLLWLLILSLRTTRAMKAA